MKILNLGCGNRIIEDADNHDKSISLNPLANLELDLDALFWDYYFATQKNMKREELQGYYDRIEMISVIEHLLSPLDALNECWVLLKPGGILVVKYPHKDSFTAYDDLTHRNFMTEYSLDYVDPRTYYGKNNMFYTDKKWHILTPVEQRKIVKPHNRGDRINVKMELEKII